MCINHTKVSLPYFTFSSSSLKPEMFPVEAAFEMTRMASAKQPTTPAAKAKHQNIRMVKPTRHTTCTESWGVQVIPGILQAGDNSILWISAVRSRIHLAVLTVNPNISLSSPSWFCFTRPGTDRPFSRRTAQLQHRNHPSTTHRPHRHSVDHLMILRVFAAEVKHSCKVQRALV